MREGGAPRTVEPDSTPGGALICGKTGCGSYSHSCTSCGPVSQPPCKAIAAVASRAMHAYVIIVVSFANSGATTDAPRRDPRPRDALLPPLPRPPLPQHPAHARGPSMRPSHRPPLPLATPGSAWGSPRGPAPRGPRPRPPWRSPRPPAPRRRWRAARSVQRTRGRWPRTRYPARPARARPRGCRRRGRGTAGAGTRCCTVLNKLQRQSFSDNAARRLFRNDKCDVNLPTPGAEPLSTASKVSDACRPSALTSPR